MKPDHPSTEVHARRIGWWRFGPLLLLLLAVLLLAGPTLLAWWLLGGPFGWRHLLIGGGVSVTLLGGFVLTLGWAFGRVVQGGGGPKD